MAGLGSVFPPKAATPWEPMAATILAPAELLKREVGAQRSTVQLAELLILKKRFGISLQALREANPDVDPTKMRVGTVLVIPAP